ncbi:MAG: S8 family serine peptidase [Gemmatimonadetes bacterium]|nr:S8 family serine peptidase [Gemmatimonadota bacterium]
MVLATGVITVAVVDSGVNVPHPHLPGVAGGVSIDLDGVESGDFVDRLGHGTAAAAAIHEKAPAAELWAVKVFDKRLATTVENLVTAIVWAVDRKMRLVNLSLGTPNDFKRLDLAPAIEAAVNAGTIIVSAAEHDGQLWFPGSMPGVVGVVMDVAEEREGVTVVKRPRGPALRASPYPRPIPGVPPERNFNGISFAVANATGVVAQLLSSRPDVRTAGDVFDALACIDDRKGE